VENQNIMLTRGGVITGRVVDADGKPIIDQNVVLVPAARAQSTGAAGYVFSPFQFQTDDRGVYRIYGCPQVAISSASGKIKTAGWSWSEEAARDTRARFIEWDRRGRAKVIEVAAGDEVTGIDITLEGAAKTYEATGRIEDAVTGKPVSGATYGFGTLRRTEKASARLVQKARRLARTGISS
jgi:hypothetical protein